MTGQVDANVLVDTPFRTYDVLVGRDILDRVGSLTSQACGGSRCCVVSDSNVAPLYADEVLSSLGNAGYDAHLIKFPAGERSKTMRTLSTVLEGLSSFELTRDDVVVALGGGVVGDVAGLAAATYLRGCQVVQVPTSLLAMVDSSVGGKTAVDLPSGKNLVGSFFQPSLVLADVTCLRTVSHSLLTDSCGEVIKHGIIADATLFADVARSPINAPDFDEAVLADVVARNVRIKRDVVDSDEHEHGLRQILNFGHTIGHAVEAASDYSLGHGSCVGIGMCAMTRACCRRGICDDELVRLLEEALRSYGLPTDTDIDHDVLFGMATSDKKRHADQINVVVPTDIGHVEVRTVGLGDLRDLIDLGCGLGA
jgi:3-dehydroquinate synthase